MRRILCALAFGVLPAVACSNGGVTYAVPPTIPDGDGGVTPVDSGLPPGLGVGQSCDAQHACRAGLTCDGGKCAPGHSLGDGTPCVISDECKTGDYCGPARTCTAAGAGADGDGCASDADCAAGLKCELVGLTTECKPEGSGDVGGACTTSADCFGGLACVNKTCAPLPPSPGGIPPLGIPPWPGVTCQDDPLPAKAYFRVPRGANDGDFFRLPFPNDVRRKSGHPDLTGFPTPGSDLLGFDIVDRYARDVEANTDGFSAYTTVTFRFNASVDFPSLKQQGVIRWVDVTPGGTGDDVGFAWSATTGRNQYVCENALSARAPNGSPLGAGKTYAVLITTAAQAAGGGAIARDDDFGAVIGGAAPSDPVLSAAWTAYKPLRDWLTAKALSPTAILNAAVFTVGHPGAPAQGLATAVAAAAAPTAASWVKCGAAPSPCPQATGDRACGAADPAFDELHALVTLPIFQSGTAPYEDTGGDLQYDGAGVAKLQRTEQVCLALTIPKAAAMPAGGWPLVLYAHGTGGSFRSHITEGSAARFATIDDGAGGQIHAAVLGIDQVEHGTRRGASTVSPNNLFFNFSNPGAARGNPLQGAADQMALVRFAKALDLVAGSSPTGAEIKFGSVAYWGHSQGATEGAIAMPYTAGVSGVVLSGEGASLIDALLTKKSPVDIADAIPFALEDPGVSTTHPVMSLLQNAIDVADPLNHARFLAVAPIAPITAKHVFQPYGLKDTFAPPVTEATYALAAGLGLLQPSPSASPPDPIGTLTAVPVPASGNLGAAATSAFVREYGPSGYDGHFVAFKEAVAQADVAHFLADALAGKVPKVGR
jgi:hypothetical protein